MELTPSFLTLLQHFSPVFTAPNYWDRRQAPVAASGPSIARIVRALTGWTMPRSVMIPAISSAGVTSNAGL